MEVLRGKLRLPSSPPDPARISPDIMALHTTIAARYIGAASLISLKTPQEGFQTQDGLLQGIRKGYTDPRSERIFMLSPDQHVIAQARLQNYCNFGGHGSGKTLLQQMRIKQDAEEVVSNPDIDSYCQIVCVWQDGANALLNQYKELQKTLPKADNLETIVVTKKELITMAMVKEEPETTYQINSICKNLSKLKPNTEFHVYIDECWVTVPSRFSPHTTAVSNLQQTCA